MSDTLLCRKCGVELPTAAVFCHMCGTKQVVPERRTKSRGNGQGTAYKRGKTWTAEYVYGWECQSDGKKKRLRRTKGGFRTKKEALDYLETLKVGKVAARTMEMYWQTFYSSQFEKLSVDKKSAYKKAHERMLPLMSRDITTVSISELQNIINTTTTTYYPAKDIKNLISKIYQLAMVDQVVTINLSKFLTLPANNETETQPFPAESVDKLWTAFDAGDIFCGYILLMIYTGMMPGELRALRYDMIDFDKRQIFGVGKKTKVRREASIILGDKIVPVLKLLCASSDNKLLQGVSETKFYSLYYAALERNDIPRLTPYSCRHTAGTNLALSGAAMSAVQRIMRHAKITTTQRYIHIDDAPMVEVVNKLD